MDLNQWNYFQSNAIYVFMADVCTDKQFTIIYECKFDEQYDDHIHIIFNIRLKK